MADTMSSSLMTLPYEVRQNVLEQYFRDQEVVVMPQCKGKPYEHPKCDTRLPSNHITRPHSCTAVFLVCKQLTEEATPVFLKEATFDLTHFLEVHQCTPMKTFAKMQNFYGTTELLHSFNMPGFPSKGSTLEFDETQKIRKLHVVLGETFWKKGEKSCISVMRSLKHFAYSDNKFDLSIEIALPRWKSDNPSIGVTIDSKTRERTYWPESNRPLIDRWPWRMFLQRIGLAPGDTYDSQSEEDDC